MQAEVKGLKVSTLVMLVPNNVHELRLLTKMLNPERVKKGYALDNSDLLSSYTTFSAFCLTEEYVKNSLGGKFLGVNCLGDSGRAG